MLLCEYVDKNVDTLRSKRAKVLGSGVLEGYKLRDPEFRSYASTLNALNCWDMSLTPFTILMSGF